MPQYPVASQNAYTPAQLLHSRAATQGLQFLGRAYGSWARLTVPTQGLLFPGKAYSSRAGLTVLGQGLRFRGIVMCR